MANNPLEQFFRQPKIFINLPSHGAYHEVGVTQGDPSNMPVYSMTAMDEIVAKTPDAMFTGESTVRMIQSCCPSIKNAWGLSVLDTDLIFAAIRIATYGNMLSVSHTCPGCQANNEYDLDLSRVVDHLSSCKYKNTVVMEQLTIRTQPVTYRVSTDIAIQQYQMNKRLVQLEEMEDSEEKQKMINELFVDIGKIQTKFFIANIESIDIGQQVVTERQYIEEFMNNCDKTVYDAIKKQVELNQETWKLPIYNVKCTECSKDNDITINLDQSNFFVQA